jgi:SAM-dependent methyltransferase
MVQPLMNYRGRSFWRLPVAYARFWQDWRAFRRLGGRADWDELNPTFFDSDPRTQSGGGHYFYQDIWALSHIAAIRPAEHHDVGSRIDGFVGQLTAISPVVYWDIRPPAVRLPRFRYQAGSILALPVPEGSLLSLSCLHTAEHVGLGRYGDPLDPEGTTKALRELMRVLARGGKLLISMPVGRDRVCFNAQRIWHPQRAIDVLSDLTLVEFAAVTDGDEFVRGTEPALLASARYACGLYLFSRPA